ncbi:transglycosylase domain-containing protein [Demequina capsici]|uniref:Transglycosylase domain-containing protein n=1 Tax=Demequina capsici TaxID=3075620 RepID=A0AA96F9E5_9MICO|nr:transglycosylase domain-containing protein [Demequina sp. OYTSA14]WNM24461.1 transglycosylase domain-containing protein [Demequina sp. OYTSA14]
MSDDPKAPRRQSVRPTSAGQAAGPRPTRQTTGVTRASTGASSASVSTKGAGKGSGDGKPPKAPWKVWGKRIGIGVVVTGLVLFTAAAIGLFVKYQSLTVPQPDQFALFQSSTVYYSDGVTPMGALGQANREIITYEEMPQSIKDAIVASEDRTFWTNKGVDLMGTARALYKTVIKGEKQGGSTITQQYVERYYSGKTVTDIPGKIEEALMALKVSQEQSKSEVLANYLNTIYFGRGAYGIQAAAQAYYGKDAADLTVSESAMLVGIVPAPSAWDPRNNATKAEERWNHVLDAMVATGALSQEERDAQVFPDVIEYTNDNVYAGPTGYLIREALDEVIATGLYTQEEIETSGLSIITTINKTDQDSVEAAVAAMPSDHSDHLRVAAVTVAADTGAITSMYGGADYLTIQRNAVTQDIAQAGSTFKPFALITALSQGIGLGTQYLANNNMTLDGYDNPVRNFGGVSYGVIDLVKATQNSVNTAFVQLTNDVGPENVMNTAITAGVPADTTDLNANPSIVLGAAAPHPIDMANAYATIASGGVRTEAYMVETVNDATGTPVYQHEVVQNRVFDANVIADTTYAMQQVVKYGSGKTASSLGRDIAGKTGTSNDNKSAWFIGFTPQIVGAVALYQVGDDGSVEQIDTFGGYKQITGSTVPCDIWTAMMGPILDEYPAEAFPARANVGTDRLLEPTASPTPSATPTPEVTTTAPEPSPSDTTTAPTPAPTKTTTAPSPSPSQTTTAPAAAAAGAAGKTITAP